MRLRIVIACGGLAPLLIAASQPVVLQPSSPWVVDYAENSCRLIRNFGEGKTLTKLVFESQAPHDVDMLIIGKPLERSDEKVAASFVPVGGELVDGMAANTTDKGVAAVLWGHVAFLPDSVRKRLDDEAKQNGASDQRPAAAPSGENAELELERQQFTAAVTGIEIDVTRNRPVVLETGSLRDPMKVFDQCGRDSLKDWGVDPDLEDRIVRGVWAINPTKWLFANDYPAQMIAQGKEAEVRVRLLVDASGKVTRCTSLSHFNEPEFNQITCDRITTRARFEPAELADGTKVPSYYTRSVRFVIGH